MKSDDTENVVFLIVIANRKHKDAILAAMLETGIHLINTTYAKGTVKATILQAALGLAPEENKAFITCVSTCKKADAIMATLIEKFDFDKPNTGIAFTIPVAQLSF